jgi:uncharacterized protein YxjI
MAVVTVPPPPTRACPKCAYESVVGTEECPACGVVIDKYVAAERRIADVVEARPAGSPLARLADAERLSIKQQVERLEMWTGFETANQYVVQDGSGRVLFDAAEESGSVQQLLGRMFLKALRPFTLHVATADGTPALRMERPFRFFFSEVSVRDAGGRELGTIARQFSLLDKRYLIRAAGAATTYEVLGPLFRPWTFKILANGEECGVITKKWSGLFKESFTDADQFGIQFPPGITVDCKAVFLGAVFLIDFVHFEENNG